MNHEEISSIARALSHPTRVAILDLLVRRGETCVCEIARALGINQPSASKHLNVLRVVNLVTFRREGLMYMYRSCGPRVGGLLDFMAEMGSIESECSERTGT
ncbi:MAG: metalloregulator ArsR/SmtB family transcription factor [Bacillota bacterium]